MMKDLEEEEGTFATFLWDNEMETLFCAIEEGHGIGHAVKSR